MIGESRVGLLAVLFLITCIGLGYFGGELARRRGWKQWLLIFMSAGIAIIWPVVFVADSWYGLMTHFPTGLEDPGDAPLCDFVIAKASDMPGSH